MILPLLFPLSSSRDNSDFSTTNTPSTAEGLHFRLFGNCWIEQPCQKELEAISQYIPSMAALEAHLPSGICFFLFPVIVFELTYT